MPKKTLRYRKDGTVVGMVGNRKAVVFRDPAPHARMTPKERKRFSAKNQAKRWLKDLTVWKCYSCGNKTMMDKCGPYHANGDDLCYIDEMSYTECDTCGVKLFNILHCFHMEHIMIQNEQDVMSRIPIKDFYTVKEACEAFDGVFTERQMRKCRFIYFYKPAWSKVILIPKLCITLLKKYGDGRFDYNGELRYSRKKNVHR